MGILGLSRLIADISPESIKEVDLKSLFGRRIAIDASMCIYQFLIAIRNNEYMMTNDSGDTTSHLVGLFYRTIKMLETGIKPVYVFDGKAPKLKCGELTKRAERRIEAQEKLDEAKELQNVEDIERFNKRLVRVTRKHNEDCKKLLGLLGIPVVQAPSEAEAQCAQLCKEGLVYAAATEDMDALTFACPVLIRNLTSANNEKIKEFHVERILSGLNLTQDQFIDLSILMGCDYCDNIKGIGGKKGLDLIRKFDTIEGILENKFGVKEFIDVEIEYNTRSKEENVDKNLNNAEEAIQETVDEIKQEEIPDETKTDILDKDDVIKEEENLEEQDLSFNEELKEGEDEEDDEKGEKTGKKNKKGKNKQVVPENWPFRGARKLFQEPYVLKGELSEQDLRQKDPDEEGLIQFLCTENGFSEERVRNAIKRVKDSKNKSSQTRIDTFFKILPSNGQHNNKTNGKSPSLKRNNTSASKSKSKRGRPSR